MKGLLQTTATIAIVCLLASVLLRCISLSEKCQSINTNLAGALVYLTNAKLTVAKLNGMKKPIALSVDVTSAGKQNQLYNN
jgi:hypothetical protein